MSDKQQVPDGAYFALPDTSLVTLAGRDAVAFAQAQFMNDVAALADGHWHWNGWLTPKGRVIALFALVRRSAEALDLVLLDAEPGPFTASLGRFVFRSKVVLGVREDWRAAGAFRMPESARGHVADAGEDALELDVGGADQPRVLRFAATDAAPADDAALARWRGLDMALGLPRLAASQAETWTPQQLSLERLRAFSVKKGCYPGQEIVARTHFLGQVRRGLVGLQGAAHAAPGDEVLQDGRAIGRLVCVAPDIQLAVLPLERADTALTVAEAAVVPCPLRSGLER